MENVEQINNNKKKIRIDYIDIAKFIGILLVILGHTTGNLDTPLYRVILYAFHMPLFFIVSGVVVKRNKEKYNWKYWLTFFRKNILGLVVPYLIWALIYSPFKYRNNPNILYASWETLVEVGTLTSLWYLPCLFIARIFTELVMMLISYINKLTEHIFTFIVAIIFFAIGFLIPHPSRGLPWCIDIAFVAAGFILLGYSIKMLLYKIYHKPIWIHILINLLALGIFITGILVQRGDPYLVLMAKADYGNIALFLTNAISGSTLVLALSAIITKLFEKDKTNIINRFMLWVGRSTIGIYLIHKNFLQEVIMENLAKTGIPLPNLGLAILGTVLAFIYSCGLVFIINRYVPQLFGIFPSNKTIVLKEEDYKEKANESEAK